VNITTSTTVAASSGPQPIVPEGSPFEDFFRDFMDRNGDGGPPQRSQALGSGFVISEDGFIVTNNHVIQGADEIRIEFFSGKELTATVVGTDPNTDLALLKVEADEPLPFVPWGDSDEMRVGDWVMAMGNPLGQGFSVSAGIVSARGRALSGSFDDYIQTDAAINRGNSGGPLFNMDGEVIGVNTAILSPSGGSIGIGFAMSSRVATNVIAQLREFGETRRGWLGVRIQDVSDDVAEAIGLQEARGALVTDVPEGPSAEAGMAGGRRDPVLRRGGRERHAPARSARGQHRGRQGSARRRVPRRALADADGHARPPRGSRGGARLGARHRGTGRGSVLGMTVSTMTDELREQLALPSGTEGLVVRDVVADSEAFEKGLRAGDVIAEAGQQAVSTPPSCATGSRRRATPVAGRSCCSSAATASRASWRWRSTRAEARTHDHGGRPPGAPFASAGAAAMARPAATPDDQAHWKL
jgi:serine protease Do